ncbi:MAG: hypothetical protein ABID61_01590, partial [Candidatus Micrarchaeota archaeon]
RPAYVCYAGMLGYVGEADINYMQYTLDKLDISLPTGSRISSVKVKVQDVTGQVQLYGGLSSHIYLEGNYDTLGGCMMGPISGYGGSRGLICVSSGVGCSGYPYLIKDTNPKGKSPFTYHDAKPYIWASNDKYGSTSPWITLGGYSYDNIKVESLVSTISAKAGQAVVSDDYSRNHAFNGADKPCGAAYQYEFEITYYEDTPDPSYSIDLNGWGDECWAKKLDSKGKLEYDTYTGFYNYLFAHQDKLVNAGSIGILYKNYKGLPGTSAVVYPDTYNPTTKKIDEVYSGASFCGLQKGSQYLLKEKPSFIYQKVYAMPSVACIPCTDYEIQTGRCKKSCANGVDCTVKTTTGSLQEAASKQFKEKMNQSAAYFAPVAVGITPNTVLTNTGSISNKPFQSVQQPGYAMLFGVYTVASMSQYIRCPDNLIPEPCTKCSSLGGTLNCNITYMNGSVVSENPYNVNEMNYLYGDIIASMPQDHLCCLNDSAGNYTFVKMDTSSSNNAPIVFPENGDPLQDCGLISPSLLAGSFCGIQLPVKDYKRECSLEIGGVVYFTGIYSYNTQNKVSAYASATNIGGISTPSSPVMPKPIPSGSATPGSGLIPNPTPSGGSIPFSGGSST